MTTKAHFECFVDTSKHDLGTFTGVNLAAEQTEMCAGFARMIVFIAALAIFFASASYAGYQVAQIQHRAEIAARI